MTLTWVGRRCHGANSVLLAVNVTGKPELFLEEQFFMTCTDSESWDPEGRFLEDLMCSLMTKCGFKTDDEATQMCVCVYVCLGLENCWIR